MTDIRNVTDDHEPGDEERYRLYRLCECVSCSGTGKAVTSEVEYRGAEGITAKALLNRCVFCRGEGRTRELVATATDAESVGVALVTLGREGEWDDCPIGCLDTMGEPGKKWLVRPWTPSARNISDAARTLRRARG